MPSQTPTVDTPTTGPDTAGPAEQTAPATERVPADQTSTVDEQRLTEAEQRATEHQDRAGQLQAALDAVQQALNPGGGETAGDPAQLATAVADRDRQLDQVAAELRTAKVGLAAHKSAAEHCARADRLLNSRSFLDSVNGLDPNSPKFEQQLGGAITTSVEAGPDLYRSAGPGPAKGGAEFNGPPAADKRPATLRDAVAARLN